MNFLEQITIEEVLILATLGFEIELNDGCVTGIIDGDERRIKLIY